jgi:hypothetical protein
VLPLVEKWQRPNRKVRCQHTPQGINLMILNWNRTRGRAENRDYAWALQDGQTTLDV